MTLQRLEGERSGERPKYRLNFDTALRYDCCVAGDRLQTLMSSIMRRRRGLISAIGKPPVSRVGLRKTRDPLRQEATTDRPLTAAPAASFNPWRVSHSAAWYNAFRAKRVMDSARSRSVDFRESESATPHLPFGNYPRKHIFDLPCEDRPIIRRKICFDETGPIVCKQRHVRGQRFRVRFTKRHI